MHLGQLRPDLAVCAGRLRYRVIVADRRAITLHDLVDRPALDAYPASTAQRWQHHVVDEVDRGLLVDRVPGEYHEPEGERRQDSGQ